MIHDVITEHYFLRSLLVVKYHLSFDVPHRHPELGIYSRQSRIGARSEYWRVSEVRSLFVSWVTTY